MSRWSLYQNQKILCPRHFITSWAVILGRKDRWLYSPAPDFGCTVSAGEAQTAGKQKPVKPNTRVKCESPCTQ